MNQPALKSMALFFIIIMVSVRCNDFSEGVVQDNQNALLCFFFVCFDVWYFMCVPGQSVLYKENRLAVFKVNKNILFIVKKKKSLKHCANDVVLLNALTLIMMNKKCA